MTVDDGARMLGHYQLLSQLAVGGMAEIYVAKTGGVGGFEKLVALKVIHPNFSADPEFVQMLVDEAKLSVQLQHANIVQTFDLGRVDEQYYIAMELIDGVDLYKLLRRASEHDIDFPFEVAAFICAEVCAGLDYAHRKRDSRGRPLKIVHRDVSPQNVLVSYDGEVKIVDFGIAKAAMRSQNTAAGVIKGKYYYMSPEQAWGDPIDARTDIFSAGILLYEMIVGQMLYMEEDIDKLLEIVRKAAIAPPSSKRIGVPRELEAIVMRALKKRADDRWPQASELGTVLGQFQHGFAPDFNRSKLAAFVREVMGDDPTAQRRDPRTATGARVSEPEVRDENSLLFKLRNGDGAGMAQPLSPQSKGTPPRQRAPTPAPRRADVATNVGPTRDETGQRLGPAVRVADGFEENEATIVDSKGETLLALVPDGGESDSTRPAGPALRRGSANVPSGRFDLGEGDPAKDADLDAPTVNVPQKRAGQSPVSLDDDDDDMPTGARLLPRSHATRPIESPPDDDLLDEPRRAAPRAPESPPSLPGMVQRERQSKATPLGVRSRANTGSQQVLSQPAPSPSEYEDEDTGQRMSPTLEMKRAPRPAPHEIAGHEPARAPSPPPTPPPSSSLRDRPPSGAQAILKAQPPRDRPPSGAQAILKGPPPPSPSQPPLPPLPTKDAPTLTLPPSANPVASPLQPVKPGAVHKQSFDEPTRIPPPSPPPIDSGNWQSPDGHAAFPFSSPLADPADVRPRRRSPMLYVAIAGSALLTALVVGIFTLGGDGNARGTLTIVSVPVGAEVRIDGNVSPQPTPLTLGDVDLRQTHHVRVSKSGYDVWESDVKFPAGEREVRVQAVLMSAVGTVEIASTPLGAEAIVNGRIRGMTPTTVGDLPPNDDVVIELRLRGYKVAHKTVSWSSRRLIQLSIPLEKAK